MKFLFRILRRLVGYLLGVLLVALIAAAATFGWQGYKLYQSAVQATPLETLYQSITARPSFVPYDQLPQTYINAVLSVEDSRFVHHHGVDPLSIARALWADLRSGTLAEGGSTITQQLTKNVYFTQEKRMARKAAEMFAALDIEKHYSKQEIFEMYVNTIYFGNGCYGVAEAAEGYFKTDAASLTDAQAVVLAGLPQAPSVYASSPALAHKQSPGGTAADGGLPQAHPGCRRPALRRDRRDPVHHPQHCLKGPQLPVKRGLFFCPENFPEQKCKKIAIWYCNPRRMRVYCTPHPKCNQFAIYKMKAIF